MLTFDDFLIGMEQFGTRIQPRMRSRMTLMNAAWPRPITVQHPSRIDSLGQSLSVSLYGKLPG